MAKLTDKRVFYCSKCGRARLGHTSLSDGKIAMCDGDVADISLSEWVDVAKKGDRIWQLTEAGRAALAKNVEG